MKGHNRQMDIEREGGSQRPDSRSIPFPQFVWPEPRVMEGMCSYQDTPPFKSLALTSSAMFGIVPALTLQGVKVLESWITQNDILKVRLIVAVYPVCATRKEDLALLLDLVARLNDRLAAHILPLEKVTDHASTMLCFLASQAEAVHMVTGPSQDLGLEPWQQGQVNCVFRANPLQAESFKRYFDWLWTKSAQITGQGVLLIPDLVLPEGTEEGARMWRDYVSRCSDSQQVAGKQLSAARIDSETGEVSVISKTCQEQEIESPTDELGMKKLDHLAEFVARIYERGSLVSTNKLSRIPPLDAPLDPRLFGDVSEIHQGAVTRKINMRVSLIDQKTLKDIEKRRQGLRTILAKFTFGLADSMRWMPDAARSLFESELNRVNEEGKKLISDLLRGDVRAFIEARRGKLINDIIEMHKALGRQGRIPEAVINEIISNIEGRLEKAQSVSFMPELSYSAVSFVRTESGQISPWGQAYSLLKDIAAFPRKILTDSFFLRGIKVEEEDLIEAMNVADDVLCRDFRSRGIKKRCTEELGLLALIDGTPMESRERCELVRRILAGDSIEKINQVIKERRPS